MVLFKDKPEIRKMEFLYVRFHFEGLFSGEAKQGMKKFLEKSENKTVEDGRFRWAFGDIGSQTIDETEILFGRLGRTITEKFETVYDKEKHSYKKELIKSSEASYSNFFIFPAKNIMAFEEKYNLRRSTFIRKFKQFWTQQEATDLYFEFLKDEVEIFEIVKSWDSLTKATFDLVPSNPSSRDDWKSVDVMIQKAKAKRAKFEFQNKEGTLEKEGSVIQQSMSMAADGYGEFRLRGIKDNVVQTFNSLSRIIKTEIHSVDELKAVISQVHNEVKRILHRNETKNKE